MANMGYHIMDVFPSGDTFNWRLVVPILIWIAFGIILAVWIFISLFVPSPRQPLESEMKFTTVGANGDTTDPTWLPYWFDNMMVKYYRAKKEEAKAGKIGQLGIVREKMIDDAEVFMTVVVPAFNEESRLEGMLEEAVNYLEVEYGTLQQHSPTAESIPEDAKLRRRNPPSQPNGTSLEPRGWEILIVDDGSTDDTILTAQTFSRRHILPSKPRRMSGPWTHRSDHAVKIPPGAIRMIQLEKNRGKGGAVTHGMRHARGKYVVFADADGASNFTDLGKLVSACQKIEDDQGRGIAVGSRAHLVGSEAVVKRSALRNFLMHSFHLLLKLMTPPKTRTVKDTQCGFKLFSRPTLPYIIPHMHMDGWIFDVEMLMLAEFADIPVVEVAVGWREVVGSKLNVIKDSIGMAWGLAILRVCWGLGIYHR